MKRWRQLPLAKQSKILNTSKVLLTSHHAAASPRAQLQQQQVFNTPSNWSRVTRGKCVQGFQKFVALSPPEREQFMSNLNRWNKMTPAARNA